MDGERGAAMFLAREASPKPVTDELAAAIEDERSLVVVGTYDDVVFGYGYAVIEPLRDGTTVAVLRHFMVEEEARAAGIGEAMMNLILDTTRAAGCRGIDSTALPGDRETKNFFESFGLKARMLVVHRAFEDEADDDG
ncbi:MAG: GNAT family N-acetyltransferase [Actinomycetota bacterium]